MPIPLQLLRPLAVVLMVAGVVGAQEPPESRKASEVSAGSGKTAKKPLDHDAYDRWNSLTGADISDDGRWALYSLRPGKERAEPTLKIRGLGAGKAYEVARGTQGQFSKDNRHALYIINPDPEAVKKAEQDKVPVEKRPKARLEILHLESGKTSAVDRVSSFRLPAKAGGWVAFRLEPSSETPEPGARDEKSPGAPKTEEKKASEPSASSSEPAQAGKKAKATGSTLVLRHLSSGTEARFPNVVEFVLSEDGKRLAYASSTTDGEGDGVFVVEVGRVEPVAILTGEGNYRGLTFDEGGERLAFLSDRDEFDAEQPSWTLFSWKVGQEEAAPVAFSKMNGLKDGWWVSENQSPSFSKDGARIFFGTSPRPKLEKKAEKKEGEEEKPKVVVDVWHWKDPFLQPQQLKRAEADRRRTYEAYVPSDGGPFVQLADEEMPEVSVGSEGNAGVALGISDVPYQIEDSWESPGFVDLYLVDLATGKREKIAERHRGFATLSPAAKYVQWWDYDAKQWIAFEIAGKKPIVLSAKVPHPVFDEEHDLPAPAGPYGVEGWTKDDRLCILNDRYDLWAVDPSKPDSPVNLTEGKGRERLLRFSLIDLDPEDPAIPTEEPLLLRARHDKTKATGFFRQKIGGGEPGELILADELLDFRGKAEKADAVIVARATFQRFPDIWATNLDFKEMERLSDANPQQSEYLWGTAELVEWQAKDGRTLQGLLYKPEGFDAAKKYPMLVYFYERNSDTLHNHIAPRPSASIPNASFYVSRGYLFFVPDIPYTIGSPGPSAVNAVIPGVEAMIAMGFVDEKKIGVTGHSWGGYQTAYLVTQTNLFACAEAGAPVSNMTSAYGGIRWSSGLSRMFQYEKTQSRIGKTLWEAQQSYLDNSPLFMAPKIETPLLILHNDQDGAVPWYQGIELFVALRRLGKPAWMLNYNGEDHGLLKDENRRDWSIRMQQFFDHYLKGVPAPRWLAEGIPATEKGKTLGLEPAKTGKEKSKPGPSEPSAKVGEAERP